MIQQDPVAGRYRYCPTCGAEAVTGASFCAGCGSSLVNSVTPSADSPPQPSDARVAVQAHTPDQDILANLRGYKEHVNILCLECGYEGRMGVIRTQVPLIYNAWIWIPLVLTGIGVLWLILGVLRREQSKVREVQCPCCRRYLVFPAGAKLRGAKRRAKK